MAVSNDFLIRRGIVGWADVRVTLRDGWYWTEVIDNTDGRTIVSEQHMEVKDADYSFATHLSSFYDLIKGEVD